MSDTNIAVEMLGITKRFPGVLANDHVDFSLRRGEVHALLGENGAGKTVLVKILSGLYRADEGEIRVDERRVEIRSPRSALGLGIGMVHQHFVLATPLSVVENITAGLSEPRFWLNLNRAAKDIKVLANQYGLDVDPWAKIWQLSVGEQQRVEILRLLFRRADILILDEPTSVLTPQEASDLFAALRLMASQGRAIVFISHKLDEVFAVADRITVLRRGRVVGTIPVAKANRRELVRMMVGQDVMLRVGKEAIEPGEVVLVVRDVHADNERGLSALRGISFEIRRGEILGVAGVAGNGQRELAEVICGLRPLTHGQIEILGQLLERPSARWVIDRAGVSYIPEDRVHTATVQGLSLTKNVLLKKYRQEPFAHGAFIDWPRAEAHTGDLMSAYRIQAPSHRTKAGLLSGGNLQRLILAREVSANSPLLIAVHPTFGLDVAATEFVRQTLLDQRGRGASVLLISEDLEEILTLSDRVAVICDGQLMGIVDDDEVDIEAIGMMMAGTPQSTLRDMDGEVEQPPPEGARHL